MPLRCAVYNIVSPFFYSVSWLILSKKLKKPASEINQKVGLILYRMVAPLIYYIADSINRQ